jgi:hypothetical protein
MAHQAQPIRGGRRPRGRGSVRRRRGPTRQGRRFEAGCRPCCGVRPPDPGHPGRRVDGSTIGAEMVTTGHGRRDRAAAGSAVVGEHARRPLHGGAAAGCAPTTEPSSSPSPSVGDEARRPAGPPAGGAGAAVGGGAGPPPPPPARGAAGGPPWPHHSGHGAPSGTGRCQGGRLLRDRRTSEWERGGDRVRPQASRSRSERQRRSNSVSSDRAASRSRRRCSRSARRSSIWPSTYSSWLRRPRGTS